MAVHEFVPQQFYNTIGTRDPVLYIEDGDTVKTSTLDARGGDGENVTRAPRSNPVIGPFYVKNAEPGDTIALQFESIRPNRDTGWTGTILASHVVDSQFVRQLPISDRIFWKINHEEQTARLIEPFGKLGHYTLPLKPFLGCFGVAPARGQAILTTTAGPHGGNMDYRGFTVGTTIYFPVFVEGALLHFGDGHGFQGDGEIAGTGLEISMDIAFKVQLIKNKTIHWPRGESDTHLFTVGNTRPLDQALQHATTEMMHWLNEDYGLDAREASTILGQCVEYEIGNVFNPAYTVVCKLNKQYLNALE